MKTGHYGLSTRPIGCWLLVQRVGSFRAALFFLWQLHGNDLRMRTLVLRLWNSPVMMTWASFATRILGTIVILPLLLVHFAVEDTAVWLAFQTVVSLRLIMDSGLVSTFTRLMSYARSGASPEQLLDMRGAASELTRREGGAPAKSTMRLVCAVSKRAYLWVAGGGMLLLGGFGTWALQGRIMETSSPELTWLAWGILVSGSSLALVGNRYRSYLQAVDRIALLARWDAAFSLLGVACAVVILLLGGGLLALVLNQELWGGGRFICYRILSARADPDGDLKAPISDWDQRVWHVAWSSAWRTALAIMMVQGVFLGSGLMVTRLTDAGGAAAYLIGLRFSQFISQFSLAPFYTKVPRLAQLQVDGNTLAQISVARKGMFWSLMTFAIPFALLSLIGQPLLELIGSNVQFPDPVIWIFFGLAAFFERIGGMHTSMYQTTNHIISHIGNGATGALAIALMWLFYPSYGVVVFPAAFFIANALVLSLFGMWHSYSYFHFSIPKFEIQTSVLPLSIVLLTAVFLLQR